jgi:hypothetical protein
MTGEETLVEGALFQVATAAAAKRRQMAAEVLLLAITEDAETVLTTDEIRELWTEAVRQEWAIETGEGTFTLTEAGLRLVAASRKEQ